MSDKIYILSNALNNEKRVRSFAFRRDKLVYNQLSRVNAKLQTYIK